MARHIPIWAAAGAIAVTVSIPVHAAGLPLSGGLLDAAKVILKGRSILKAGESRCGASSALAPSESLLVSLARRGVKQAMPASQFIDLDKGAAAEVVQAAKGKDFCNETKAAKPNILKGIRDAARVFGVGSFGL